MSNTCLNVPGSALRTTGLGDVQVFNLCEVINTLNVVDQPFFVQLPTDHTLLNTGFMLCRNLNYFTFPFQNHLKKGLKIVNDIITSLLKCCRVLPKGTIVTVH